MKPLPARPRPSARSLAAALAAAFLAAAMPARAQGSALASKNVRLLADRTHVWAFSASDSLTYSRLDLSKDPPEVRTATLPFAAGVAGGVGRAASVLLRLNYALSDSSAVGGVVSVEADGKAELDSVIFLRPKARQSNANERVGISALALWRDTLVVGGGKAGFAVVRPKAGRIGPLPVDTLSFQVLPAGTDTALDVLPCPLEKACRLDTLPRIAETFGVPEEVAALAVDSAAPDSAWLLIGTESGLRRGLLGSATFPRVPLGGDTGRIRIERLHVDSRRSLAWAFSGSRYFFSDDHGRTWRVPPNPPGVDTKPAAFSAFGATPSAANLGDTTAVNFNFQRPGLVLFRRDTVLRNRGTGEPADVLLDFEDGLEVRVGETRLTDPVVVQGSKGSLLAVGSDSKGIFWRTFGAGAGADTAWRNLTLQKRLSGGLDEVITYPTVFEGLTRDGRPQFVQIGYRLKKSGKVTITVYNYAMEKVKTLVKGQRRSGGGGRSEKLDEDRWDGLDRAGRRVSVGTYYILVESDQGEKGWGKALVVRGRN